MIWETCSARAIFRSIASRIESSTISAPRVEDFLASIGKIKRPFRSQLFLADVLRILNEGWVSPKSERIPLDCFILPPTSPSVSESIVMAAAKSEQDDPKLNPFILNEKALNSIVNSYGSLLAVKAMTIQVYSKERGLCPRVQDLSRQVGNIFSTSFCSETRAMMPLIPVNRDCTPMMLPIWDNRSFAARNDRVADKINHEMDRTMFISLAGLCDRENIAVPYITISPLKDAWKLVGGIIHHAGENVDTDILRDMPIFPTKSQLVNTAGCVSFGHLGTMPVYIGFTDLKGRYPSSGEPGSPTPISVFGHIHACRFKTKTPVPIGESPFDVNADTLTPCLVDEGKIYEWTNTFPLAPYTGDDRSDQVTCIHDALSTARNLDPVPNLPWAMYGPKFNVSDAAIVEAVHWWAAFAKATTGMTIQNTNIVGSMDSTGTVVLVIPECKSPMMIRGKPFFGGVVMIVPNGNHAECLYLQDTGLLSKTIPTDCEPADKMLAMMSSISAYIALYRKPMLRSALLVNEKDSTATPSTDILNEKCFHLYTRPLSAESEISSISEIISLANEVNRSVLGHAFEKKWMSSLRREDPVSVLFSA